MQISHLGCCGIREIQGLGQHKTPDAALKSFCTAVGLERGISNQRHRFAHILFSQAKKDKPYGEAFAAFVSARGLGTIVETNFKVNPNSSNPLKAFLWTPNLPGLRKWFANPAAYMTTRTSRRVSPTGTTDEPDAALAAGGVDGQSIQIV